jgi:hypothetical protein
MLSDEGKKNERRVKGRRRILVLITVFLVEKRVCKLLRTETIFGGMPT